MRNYDLTATRFMTAGGLKKFYLRQPNGDKTAILLNEKQVKAYKARGVTLYDSK